MAALDTNILLRLLVEDDAEQLELSRNLLKTEWDAGHSLFIPITVVLELEWVLRSRYAIDKRAFLALLSNLLYTKELNFESECAIQIAKKLYQEHKADFSDCIHIALAYQAGASPLWTFDKTAGQLAGAVLLQ